jgi:hypothetical protein
MSLNGVRAKVRENKEASLFVGALEPGEVGEAEEFPAVAPPFYLVFVD